MTNPLVIDLSHHNPTPDWQELRDAGTIGVILKATEGSSYIDDTWQQRAKQAFSAGLKVATYHFMRPGSMQAQMDHYLDETDALMPLGSRVCLDHEDDDVSLDDLKAAVKCVMERRPDLQITIYSGHLIKDQLGSECDDFLGQNTSLWIAQYTNAASPSWPVGTWPSWSLWQYTDRATVQGISSSVDANRWNGSSENLVKWFGPVDDVVPLPPEPEPTVNVCDISINTTPGVRVSVTVNGNLILSYAAGDEVALTK